MKNSSIKRSNAVAIEALALSIHCAICASDEANSYKPATPLLNKELGALILELTYLFDFAYDGNVPLSDLYAAVQFVRRFGRGEGHLLEYCNTFAVAHEIATDKVQVQIVDWMGGISKRWGDYLRSQPEAHWDAIQNSLPDARLLRSIDLYLDEYSAFLSRESRRAERAKNAPSVFANPAHTGPPHLRIAIEPTDPIVSPTEF